MLQNSIVESPLLQIATSLLQTFLFCYIHFCAENQYVRKLLHVATNVTPTFLFLKIVFLKPVEPTARPHSARKRRLPLDSRPHLKQIDLQVID